MPGNAPGEVFREGALSPSVTKVRFVLPRRWEIFCARRLNDRGGELRSQKPAEENRAKRGIVRAAVRRQQIDDELTDWIESNPYNK